MKLNIESVGSVCSGIEAASVAWQHLGWRFSWFSEIGTFPSKVLEEKYPSTVNAGDMTLIPDKIASNELESPDLICGGTPCQAFSLAGGKNGLNDDRGNLTLKFVDIVNANDNSRLAHGKDRTIVFWENVEGVLTDKTNAFGCLVSSLAGFDHALENIKWTSAGVIHGPVRNVAWRVLDAKYFGVPQQRRRLYVLAGGTGFFPENVLFEIHSGTLQQYPKSPLQFEKNGHHFEVFREYTDCLYSSYGTKWNGNAAAYNGSLFVVQDDRIRRFSPLECERLMGFADNYTLISIKNIKKTNRYQAVGNSWAVPVVRWLGDRIDAYNEDKLKLDATKLQFSTNFISVENNCYYADFGKGLITLIDGQRINGTSIPENCKFGTLLDIVSEDAEEELYISPVGCFGMVRRKRERNARMNLRLEEVLLKISSEMSPEEIEKRSLIQKRGKYSDTPVEKSPQRKRRGKNVTENENQGQLPLF